jgi:hypothetical protein
MTFVVLESGTKAATARLRLEAAGPIDVVLVRRLTVDGPQWHALDPRDVADRLQSAPDDARLSSLVLLDSMNHVPHSALGDGNEEGVVVDGHRVVGFSFPAAAAPPRNTRGPGAPVTVEAPPTTRGQAAPESVPTPAGGGELPSTFTAHADIEAPASVTSEEEFLVAIGLSADPVADTLGAGIFIEDLDDESPTLAIDVHLVGDFDVVDSGGAARTVEVDRTTLAHAPVAFKVKPGTPPPSFDPAEEIWIGRVMALFSYKGAPCGQSWREVRVNTTGARANTLVSERVAPAAGGSPIGPQTVPVPDLTIKLKRTPSGAADGIFSLVLTSPHFAAPVEPAELSLGEEPQMFSGKLISEVNQHVSSRVSDEIMRGIAKDIADKVPASFWGHLREVWDAVKAVDPTRIPDVLLLSDDPYVPWELAWLEDPLDDTAPRYLGAQVNIGRWSADENRIPAGAPLDVRGLGVVIGHYEGARGVAPLPSAAAEGDALTESYQARAVDATDETLDQVLSGKLDGDDPFEFEAIHFAGHGESDPNKRAAFVMLSNGTRLPDFVFRDPVIAAEKQAFLFLNACQVGSAHSMLDDYAGVAGSAMKAGFCGFVAPLWSVADDLAKEISLGFYEASANGERASEYFRRTRTKFVETETANAHTTWLAYLFYGHPATKLGGPNRRENV